MPLSNVSGRGKPLVIKYQVYVADSSVKDLLLYKVHGGRLPAWEASSGEEQASFALNCTLVQSMDSGLPGASGAQRKSAQAGCTSFDIDFATIVPGVSGESLFPYV